MLRRTCNFMVSHHEVLGVSPYCTPDELKTAYHRMVKTHHPDVGGDPKTFRSIQEAYVALNGSESAKESQNSYNKATQDAHWEYHARYHPSRDPREAQRARTDFARDVQGFRWHLNYLTVKWVVALVLGGTIVYQCVTELRNPSPITQGENDPVTFSIRKTRPTPASVMGSLNPEYVAWKEGLAQQVIRDSEPLRKKVAEMQHKNATYAVAYRGKPFTREYATNQIVERQNKNRGSSDNSSTRDMSDIYESDE